MHLSLLIIPGKTWWFRRGVKKLPALGTPTLPPASLLYVAHLYRKGYIFTVNYCHRTRQLNRENRSSLSSLPVCLKVKLKHPVLPHFGSFFSCLDCWWLFFSTYLILFLSILLLHYQVQCLAQFMHYFCDTKIHPSLQKWKIQPCILIYIICIPGTFFFAAVFSCRFSFTAYKRINSLLPCGLLFT